MHDTNVPSIFGCCFLPIFLTIISRLLTLTLKRCVKCRKSTFTDVYLLIIDDATIGHRERVQHYKWNIGHLATEVASSRSEVAPRWLTEMRRETRLISLYEDINAVDNFTARSLAPSFSRVKFRRWIRTSVTSLKIFLYPNDIIQSDKTIENTIFRRLMK